MNFGVWALWLLLGQDCLRADNLRVSIPFLGKQTFLPLNIGSVGGICGPGFGLLWCIRWFLFLFCFACLLCWLTELFNKSIPLTLCSFVVDQLDEDSIWEPRRQEASDRDVFALPLLNGLTFHVRGVGGVLWNQTCGRSIKVPPVVHGLHGLSEARGEGSPVRGFFFEIWDSVGEY